MSVVASIALLAAMSALGIALARRLAGHLTTLEQVAYGAPIGMVVGTMAFVPLGMAGRFDAGGVAVVGLGAAVVAAWLLRREAALLARVRLAALRISLLPTLVIGAFTARLALFWKDAAGYVDGDLWAGHVNLWGDWPVHLGVVTSFAYGGNFPPEHPRFADTPFGYHYLADLTAAAQVALGMDPVDALSLHSFVACVLVTIGLYAFARRFTKRSGTAVLATVLFLIGGGLGWLATAEAVGRSGDLVGTLTTNAWDRMVNSDRTDGLSNFQVVNLFFGFMASQRAFLYGLPIAFAAFSTLHVAVRRRDPRLFALAGVVAGLLPLAHLGTLLAFVLVIPVLMVIFPMRAWLAFGVTAVAVALPQLLSQLGGGVGALAAIHVAPGWEAAPDPWPVFWLKNLGFGAVFLALGLLVRGAVPERSRRFLAAFMTIFVAVNIVAFQPWTWDDHKVLVYWFLATAILGAGGIAWLWRTRSARLQRALLTVAVATMLLSGLLEHLGSALGQSRHRMLDAQAVALAAQVRERTPPDALFVTGMANHDPVAMLAGRRLFVGYENWLWAEGVPYLPRRAIVKRIYAEPDARDALLAENGIDFVVVGPFEQQQLKADAASFLTHYPVVARTDDWLVFDVRGLRAAAP